LELEEARESGPGGLAARLGLDKSTVSRTVDELVRMGLVSRVTDPSDRRYSLLSMTPAGHRKANVIHRINDEIIRKTFGLIPRARQRAVLESFRMLVDATVALDRQQRGTEENLCCTKE
jgi:DNA-binding MarR family transcriptional regulator